MKKLALIFFAIVLVPSLIWAQLPDCTSNPSNIIYIQTGSSIYNYDVTLPVSATNPSLNTISMPSGGGGLAVSNNLNAATPAVTFYTSVSNNWWYYNGTTWVNTGHSCGNTAAVNSGGGGNYIYNLVGGTGQVYQYDGTGNSTLLLTVPGFNGGGPYDLVGDCDGGFYILKTSQGTPAPFLHKYSSAGALVQSWTTTGSAGTAGGGFAIVNNTVYYNNSSGFNMAPFTPGPSNLAFGPVGATTPSPSDMACCRVCANLTPPRPTADFSFSRDTICAGDCISLTDLSVNGPTSWSWTFPGGTPSTDINQNPANICFNTPGTYTVQLIATNQYGSDTVAHDLLVYPVPNANVVGKKDVCLGKSTTLTANPPGFNYLWSNAAITRNISVSPTSNTDYTVIVSNAACADTATVTVEVNPLPTVTAVSTQTNCDANTGTATAVAFLGTTPYSYLWAGGFTTTTISSLAVGNYAVTVTDAKGCTAITAVDVSMRPNPIAVVTPYPTGTVRIGESIQLNASGGISFNWTPYDYLNCMNCANPVSSPKIEQIQYCVDVTDEYGCMDTACTTIIVDTSCSNIFIPNAFTPNNDNLNDYISIKNTCLFDRLQFTIFNRWGQKVFHSTNMYDKWDGTLNGEPQPTSTYFYYLEADLINGRTIYLRGDITLIR